MKEDYAGVGKANPTLRLVGYANGREALESADVVVSCVPETPQTIGMISAAQFEKIKKALTSSMIPG